MSQHAKPGPTQTAAVDAHNAQFDGPSKSQRKRDAHAVQSLGQRLVGLSSSALKQFELPEKLYDAVVLAQSIRANEARRRQMQYIGKLMRDLDTEPIEEKFAERDGTSRRSTARMHAAERWRERLLADDSVMTELFNHLPGLDVQAVRACVRAARKEQAGISHEPGVAPQGNPRHYRELYRILHQAIKDADRASGAADTEQEPASDED